MMNAAGKGNSL